MINKADYKRQYQEELRAAAQQQDMVLDNPANAALLSSPGSPLLYTISSRSGNETEQLLAILRDKSKSGQVRALALQKLDIELANRDDLQLEVLAILRNKQEPMELRQAALLVLQQITFSSNSFVAKRPEYMDALRTIVDEPDPKFRADAIEILSANGDEFVQRRLTEGLQAPDKALEEPEKAIQFLSYDIHAEYFPLLREIVRNPPNKSCKIEAIRALGADTASQDMLKQLWLNKNEDVEVRTTSAVAASSLNPENFEQEAKEVIMDESEDEDIRAVCLNALYQSENQLRNRPATLRTLERSSTDTRFEEFVRRLREQRASGVLQEASEMYLYNSELRQRNNE